jgi:hypothetical protein
MEVVGCFTRNFQVSLGAGAQGEVILLERNSFDQKGIWALLPNFVKTKKCTDHCCANDLSHDGKRVANVDCFDAVSGSESASNKH